MIWKKKTKEPPVAAPVVETAASRFIHARLTGVQHWLNGLSPRIRTWLFVCLGVSFGAYYALLVFAPSFFGMSVGVDPMVIPRIIPPAQRAQSSQADSADQVRLRDVVDSLRQEERGRHFIDSLNAALEANKPQ